MKHNPHEKESHKKVSTESKKETKPWDGSLSPDEIEAEAALQKNYNEKGTRPVAELQNADAHA